MQHSFCCDNRALYIPIGSLGDHRNTKMAEHTSAMALYSYDILYRLVCSSLDGRL
jgi:hypothetical protein